MKIVERILIAATTLSLLFCPLVWAQEDHPAKGDCMAKVLRGNAC